MESLARSTTRTVRAVLGISAGFHDSSAALLVDGELVAAAAEERFSRMKHDPGLPRRAAAWCLEHAGVEPGDLTAVAYYEKPLSTYERILATHAHVGPRGFRNLAPAVATWSASKLWVHAHLDRLVRDLGHRRVPVLFAEHHQSHAAAAFHPSPFERAAILTFDGAGEWTTSSIGVGEGNRIQLRRQQRFPDSLGLFYSAFTAYCGFDVNDGEYKLMGLAPFGAPRFAEALRRNVIHVHEDGSVSLDQRWFDYRTGSRMTRPQLAALLEGPPRERSAPFTQRDADLARSVQVVLEDAVLAAGRHAHALTGARHACLAGGVALNCVANQRLVEDGPFDDIWIQPAAGDDGGALGAALWVWYQIWDEPRPTGTGDRMRGAALGPSYRHDDVRAWLQGCGVPYRELADQDTLAHAVATRLDAGEVVGWFQGAMEFGPRALGHRSILADPRDAAMVSRINLSVKGREGFRPFAPAVLAEEASRWFEVTHARPYMTITTRVVSSTRPTSASSGDFAARLRGVHSELPACTHVDGSARVQTVTYDDHPAFHALLAAFGQRTGVPVLLNTSFNQAGEPIVRTPSEALRCFLRAGLDSLVIERCLIERRALSPELVGAA